MRRALVVAPIALLASGCIDHAWSPGELAPQGAPPPRVTMFVPARNAAIAQWVLPAESPWSTYQKMTLLSALDETPQTWTMPDIEALSEVNEARLAAMAVALAGMPPDAAWFVDLRGAASVAFARRLAEQSPSRLAVVATFNHWPHEDELIPAEETLAAMVRMPPARAIDPGARPMFLLDSWRLAYKDEYIDEETVDNRYALTSADLPSATNLYAQGIRRVVYVVPWRGVDVHEEDDLNLLFRDYEAAGIEVAIVGLEDLKAIRSVDEWAARWPEWRCVIEPRLVVVDGPHLHLRSSGGWGGGYAFHGGGGGWHYGGGG